MQKDQDYEKEADLEPLIAKSSESTDDTREIFWTEKLSVSSTPYQESSKRFLFGLSVKKDTSYLNLLAMPLNPFVVSASCTFVSATMPLLLADGEYFGIDKSELGRTTSWILSVTMLVTLIATPFVAFVFEIFGRRLPLMTVMTLSVILIWLIPRVAPNLMCLCALRCLIGLNNTMVNAAPLAVDYVKQESRGRAVTINAVGVALSQLFAA